jgi:general secretion pathway protein D
MKIKIMLLLALAGSISGLCRAADDDQPSNATDAHITAILEDKLNKLEEFPFNPTATPQQLITLNYKDTPIVTIINELAAKLGINILLPQGAQAITTKITISSEQRMPLQQAWAKLTTFLDLLGYTWVPQKEYLALKKIDPNITRREGLPLFVDVPVQELPNTPDFIQTIFYLANIKINDPEGPIMSILNDQQTGAGLLSKDAFVQIDEKTNALIIVDRANSIKAAMTIIKELDLEGIPDAIEVMPLYYTEAGFVQDLFMGQQGLLALPADQQPAAAARRGPQTQQSSYFPPNTKILALARTNSIVIMGSAKAIHIIHDFIVKYIDHPLESGRSILHVYDLQYLEAQAFRDVLRGLITPSQTGQVESQAAGTGPRRDFQDVVIVSEIANPTAPVAPSASGNTTLPAGAAAGPSQGVQTSGNRLIIAARDHDWRRIKQLIEELDIPQPQVMLEVLVVDLTLQRTKFLGDQMRNPSGLSDSSNPSLNFQSAQLAPIIIEGGMIPMTGPNAFTANALMANLMEFFQASNGGAPVNLGTGSPVGSVLVSFQDPNGSGSWNVLKVLSQYANTSILSQPFIVTTNNKQASITSAENRLLEAGANAEGGAVKANVTWVPAPINIDLTPRISKIANTVNLQVIVTIEEYASAIQNNRITRQVQTNANVANGEILAIGGLMREREDIQELKVPLLGDIPILGWFFKSKQKIRNKSNLMVFITPRIVVPQRNTKINRFTSEKLCIAKQDIDDHEPYVELRDPITRWFFKPNVNLGDHTVNDFARGKVSTHDPVTNVTTVARNNVVPLQPNQVIASNERIKQPEPQTSHQDERASQLKMLVQNEENPVLTANKIRS